MGDKEATISVCITNYNKSKFIADAIDSVIKQVTGAKIEIIIIDDYSNDESKLIIDNYKKKYPDLIKAIYNQTNKGLIENFIYIVSLVSSKYIAFLDSDDYWISSEKIEKQLTFLENQPEYSLVHTNSKVVDALGNFLPNNPEEKTPIGEVYNYLIEKNFITHSSVMIRTNECKEAISYFTQEQLQSFYCNDYPVYLYLSVYTKIGYIDEKLVGYRMLEESSSHTSDYKIKLLIAKSVFNLRKYFFTSIKPISSGLKTRIINRYNYQLLYLASLQNNHRIFLKYLLFFYRKNLDLKYFLGSFKCILRFIIKIKNVKVFN